LLGLEIEALYEDPPYATFTVAGARLSLAEQGHQAEDRPGVTMAAPEDASEANVVIVLEVSDARATYAELDSRGARFLAEPYEPPWGGARFFCVDPDGYLVEIEQPA
jgi:predicted enzyme related to lactoylglutathione lyase